MPGLLDIAPAEVATEIVEIRGGSLEVRGLSGVEIARLSRRFPGMRPNANEPMSEEQIVESGRAEIATIALALMEEIADVEHEIALRLSEPERRKVFATVMRLTNPDAVAAAGPLAVAAGMTGASPIPFPAAGPPGNGISQ